MNSTSWRDVKTAMGGGTGWGLEFYDCVINNDCERLETLVEQHNIDLNAKFTEVRKKNHLDLSPIHLVAYKGYTGNDEIYVYYNDKKKTDIEENINIIMAMLTCLHFQFKADIS